MSSKKIDLNNLHELNAPAKMVLAVLVVCAILGAAYAALYGDQLTRLDDVTKKEDELKETYKSKSIQAANLENLEKELAQLRTAFDSLLKQLPTDAEIPNLIQELHQAASTNGLRLAGLSPMKAVNDGAVQTLPYDLLIAGEYNQVTKFARDVGGLSRIITLSGLNVKKDPKGGKIVLQAIASTYKVRSAEELAAEAASEEAKNKGKKGSKSDTDPKAKS